MGIAGEGKAKVGVYDIESNAGIPFGKILAYDETVRMDRTDIIYPIRHGLGVVPSMVSAIAQSPTTSTAVFWEARPRDINYIYLKCSVAKTLCRVGIVG